MGSQKSQQYSSLVVRLQPNQFIQLENRGQFYLWQDRVNARKYMVYLINPNQALSQHNLQIYQFRKLNRAFLVGIHGIFKEDQSLCSHSQRTYLMVQYLPYSLVDFHGKLCLRDGLIVLKAAFAGYRIMSYIFGPLLAAEDMIFFTEGGVPKMWSNNHLDRNEPSPRAVKTKETIIEIKNLFQNLQMSDKKIESIRNLIKIVCNSVRQGFPFDLLNKFNLIKSYEQGEETIQSYCRNNSIILDEWIELNNKTEQSKKSPLIGSRVFLERVSSNSIKPNEFNKTLDIRNQNIQFQQRPKILSQMNATPTLRLLTNQSINNNRMNAKVEYRSGFDNKNAPFVHQIITETLIKPIELSKSKYSYEYQKPMQHIYEHQSKVGHQTPQQQITPQATSQARDLFSNRSIEQRTSLPRKQEQQQREEVQSQFKSSQQEQSKSIQEQKFQLNVHQVISNGSNNQQPIPIHDKTIQMEMTQSKQIDDHIPQINPWNQFPQFASNKISKQSSDNYRSQQRDKVQVDDLSKEVKVQQLVSQINSKYNDSSKTKENNKHQHTSSLEKDLFHKKVKFAEDYTQNQSQYEQHYNKHTFGKIESDQAVQSNQSKFYKENEAKKKKKISEDQSINDRYSKYVTNRPNKSKKQKGEVGQQRTKNEGKRLFQQFRRVLKH